MRRCRSPYAVPLAFALVVLAHPLAAHASGTYRGAPVQSAGSLDAQKYDLGKRVFAGEVAGSATAANPKQAERLQRLQSRLPVAVRKRTDLAALAGRLSPEQMDALEYFLKVRYRVA